MSSKVVKVFERSVLLRLPWRKKGPNVECLPYSISIDMEPREFRASEDGGEQEFFEVQFRCPLGTQRFGVTELPADSDLYDFDLPAEFDVHGWVEHAMCGSSLCPLARSIMTRKRDKNPKSYKQDWMFYDQSGKEGTEEANGGQSPKTKPCLSGDEPELSDVVADSFRVTKGEG